MHVALVFPVLPPRLDGIGDYTARLGHTLVQYGPVSIYTAAQEFDEIPGVTIKPAFSAERRRDILQLFDTIKSDRPDWIVFQYNPFSYGRWGLNPYVSHLIRRVRKEPDRPRIGLMIHEPYVPIDEWRNGIMTTWQRKQLWDIGRQADLIFIPIEPWVKKFSQWFKNVPICHLPVGSNIPLVTSDNVATRRQLGISEERFIVGVFGTMHPSRLTSFIGEAVRALEKKDIDVVLLYIGPDGRLLKERVGSDRLIDAGVKSPEDVSRCFSAMDLYLAPFRRGVSARRGSFLVGLQHGVATISTRGEHTDPFLAQVNKDAFLLVSDQDVQMYARHACRLALNADSRQKLAKAGQKFFVSHFSWRELAERLLKEMEFKDQVRVLPVP